MKLFFVPSPDAQLKHRSNNEKLLVNEVGVRHFDIDNDIDNRVRTQRIKAYEALHTIKT
jgi:hypothetical protein